MTYDSAAGKWSAHWELTSERDIAVSLHVPIEPVTDEDRKAHAGYLERVGHQPETI